METASYWTYGIFDPRSGLCVYIGQTGDFKARKRQHLATHRAKKTKHPPGSIKTWLCEAHAAKIEPIIMPLELVETEEESLISESKWVHKFGQELGHPLRNLWGEHREILKGRQSGVIYDALVFSGDGKDRKAISIGTMSDNSKKTGYRLKLKEKKKIKDVEVIDLMPKSISDDETNDEAAEKEPIISTFDRVN